MDSRTPAIVNQSGLRLTPQRELHEVLSRPLPGKRPAPLEEVDEPQAKVGQQSGIGYELVLALDVPALQMVDQSVYASALAFFVEADERSRSAGASALPEGSREEEEEEEEAEASAPLLGLFLIVRFALGNLDIPSFWQSPVRCPGVAPFNSGYSLCVSSQRLWISFIFSTCSWTRILRSFLNLDNLPRTPGFWQPLVRCLPCPGFSEKLDFLRDDFSQCFLRAPGMWQSLVQYLPRPRYTGKLEFSGR